MLRFRWFHCLIVLCVTASLLGAQAKMPTPEQARSATSLQMVGQIGGPTSAVAVQGNYAYVGVGLRLVVLDISNPAVPTEVGSTTPFPYFVEEIAVSGTRAYVAAGGAGLRLVDISDPTNPIELSAWDSPGYAEGVAVAGNYAYLADGPYGLGVLDVSNPSTPTPVGSAYDMNYAYDVAVAGHHAYLAAAGAGLLVADVSDPAHPVELGNLDTPGYSYGVAINGTVAYVADAWGGLRIVNISDPANPVELGACATPGWVMHVAVAGSTAYVADGAFGTRVMDVSDPVHPVELGAYEVDGLARRLAVAGGTTYVADLHYGLRSVEVSDSSHPVQVGLYSPLPIGAQVAVAGNYAYVAAGFSGLRVIDISNPAHPRELATYDTGGANASDVVVSGTYVYLATFMYGPYSLHILDVSDPSHPTRVAALPMVNGQEYKDLTLVGNSLYVAYGWGLQLIDVSNPLAPVRLGSVEEPLQDTQDVAVSGTLAYVADAGAGVRIIDVSNPNNPTYVNTYLPKFYVDGIAAVDNKLYVAETSAGLQIVDVSNPNLPVEQGLYDTPGTAIKVKVSGTEAYISDVGGGIEVVDVSNPLALALVAAYDTAGLAYDTALQGNYIYVADQHGGLVILEKSLGGAASQLGLIQDNLIDLDRVEPSADIASMAPFPSMTGLHIDFQNNSVNNTMELLPSLSLASSTRVVTSALDSGPGTLRQALLDANAGDQITFDPTVFPPAHPATIALLSALPQITQGHLTIDASNAGVILDGSATPPTTSGLDLASGYNTIQGLQILHFPGYGGITVSGQFNRIGGDRTKGTGPLGQGNLLSGNKESGVNLGGQNNTVVGNLIGTDLNGTAAIGNWHGIHLCCGAINNVIGGETAGVRNIISGNAASGVELIQKGVTGNIIIGNYIGTNISGTLSLGNSYAGITIWDGPSGNIVGGNGPGEGNLISGNQTGMVISSADVNNNSVIGNFIGTDATGTIALGNTLGISLCGAGFNRVEGNLISGNQAGITVCDWGWPQNLILGNYIGIDVTGIKPLSNLLGIKLNGWHVMIGGTSAAERNVISCSKNGSGIEIGSAGTEYNWIAGNAIGTDSNGRISLGNSLAGVLFIDYSAHNFLQGNTIADNSQQTGAYYNSGVFVIRSSFNTIRRNSIYSNMVKGISLINGGNQMLLAPVITSGTHTSVSGTACFSCTVEVFSDLEDEGHTYEGTTVANSTGLWTLNRGHAFTGPYLTATATDQQGNTSEFSLPRVIGGRFYLPILRR